MKTVKPQTFVVVITRQIVESYEIRAESAAVALDMFRAGKRGRKQMVDGEILSLVATPAKGAA